MAVDVVRIDEYRCRVPRKGKMRVDGLIYADESLERAIRTDRAAEQVANVATLPGIVGHSIAMPDIHWGYGFPIGGVAAFDMDEGVVSPGGVGYDINCGVRLVATSLARDELASRRDELAESLYRRLPAGVGSAHAGRGLNEKEIDGVLREGARWVVEHGAGEPEDLDHLESGGCLPGADPSEVSDRARKRGASQLGTLGSGNHFAEVQAVDEIHQPEIARALGLEAGTIVVSVHSGSRGLGYQVCDDFLKVMLRAAERYGIELPDRQLCCAPLDSDEARRYLGAMNAAANFAFANRQAMAAEVVRALEADLGYAPREHRARTVYDVAHNIAKIERHVVDGEERELCVHRKGATRALPPGHDELPAALREVGQPVLIPGDMGRYSYVLVGSAGSSEAFASACHGAGRRLSRSAAKKAAGGRDVVRELDERGIALRATGKRTVLEEVSEAYKDVTEVVRTVEGAGLAKVVARLRPLAVVKG